MIYGKKGTKRINSNEGIINDMVTGARELIDVVADVVRFSRDAKGTVNGQSFADIGQDAIIQPFCIVSRDLVHEEYMEEIQLTALNILTSYYLKSVSHIASVDRVRVNQILSELNPDVRFESYQEDPAFYGVELPLKPNKMAMENDHNNMHGGKMQTKLIDKDSMSAVGRLVDIEIEIPPEAGSKDNQIRIKKIPTILKLIHAPIEPSILGKLLSTRKKENSLREQWHKMVSGTISFWGDFVWGNNIINAEKKLMANPDAKVLGEIKSRHRAGLLKALRGKGKAFGVGSNIVICSEEVIRITEKEMRQPITNKKMLSSLFDSMGFMVLIVVDKEYEQITIYYKNINVGSVHSISSLQRLNNNGGPDIVQVLRDLQQSDVPTF